MMLPAVRAVCGWTVCLLLLSATAASDEIVAVPPGPVNEDVAAVIDKKAADLEKWVSKIAQEVEPVLPGTLVEAVMNGSFSVETGTFIDEDTPTAFAFGEAATTDPQNAVGAGGSVGATATVDCRGSGDFTTVQAALDSLASRRSSGSLPGRILLYIKSCTYREKLTVPQSLNNMVLQGENANTVFLTWSDTAGTVVRGQPDNTKVYGTFGSASTAILANDLIVQDITFVNSAPMPDPAGPPNGQAVACRVDGDRIAFYSCRFFGWQDTLYDRLGRHYFRDCYIQGRVDFIFGNGQSIYEFCTIYSPLQGAFAAQKRELPSDTTGYVFLRCRILGDGLMTLGRAWGEYSRTIFAYSYIENTINPDQPWSDFGFPDRRSRVFFGEYKNFGPGAVTFKRNDWLGTYILTDSQAAPFITYAYINSGDWLTFPPPATSSGPLNAPPGRSLPPFPPIALSVPTSKSPPPRPPVIASPPPRTPVVNSPPPIIASPPPKAKSPSPPPPKAKSPSPPPPKAKSPSPPPPKAKSPSPPPPKAKSPSPPPPKAKSPSPPPPKAKSPSPPPPKAKSPSPPPPKAKPPSLPPPKAKSPSPPPPKAKPPSLPPPKAKSPRPPPPKAKSPSPPSPKGKSPSPPPPKAKPPSLPPPKAKPPSLPPPKAKSPNPPPPKAKSPRPPPPKAKSPRPSPPKAKSPRPPPPKAKSPRPSPPKAKSPSPPPPKAKSPRPPPPKAKSPRPSPPKAKSPSPPPPKVKSPSTPPPKVKSPRPPPPKVRSPRPPPPKRKRSPPPPPRKRRPRPPPPKKKKGMKKKGMKKKGMKKKSKGMRKKKTKT